MKSERLRSEQRGMISVLAAMSLVFIIAAAALTVDVGSAAWSKRSLQKTVDVIALDAVRALGDRKDSVVSTYAKAVQFAQESAARNNFDYANGAAGNSMTVDVGWADLATKVFTPVGVSDYSTANAVRVTTNSRSNNRFMPGTIGLVTQAVAMVDPLGAFSIGSRLVALDTTTSPILNSVLGDMLGGSVNLTAAGYNGLANASLTFGEVWSKLGLGSASQILNSQVTVKNYLNAMASALNDKGDPSSVAAATTLGTLAQQIDPNVNFKFGDWMEFASGDPGAAASARLDILQMVGMAATVANGTNLVDLSLPISIPGVLTTTLKMGVIEAPRWARGAARKNNGVWMTHAETAQARLQFDLTLLQKLTVLLSQGTVHLPVYLDTAGAKGELTNIRCAINTSTSDITVHTTTQLVSAKIGTATLSSLVDPLVPPDIRTGNIVSIAGLVNVTVTSATATMPGSVTDLIIPLLQTRSAGAASVTLDDVLLNTLNLTVQVLGLGVNAGQVLNDTLAILSPVLSTLDTTLLTPIKKALGSLGIEIGGADVFNGETACGNRTLIG